MHFQVEKLHSTVDSPERMTEVIREIGIIPFFRSGIPGWSIEEMTDPAFWFYTSDELGPWDWKIDAVRQGDIAYGKFLSGKASFATAEWYRHLMNIRRVEPKYRMALGERFQARTLSEKLMKYLAPVALVEQVSGLAALDAGEHAVHFHRPVAGILVGPVAVDGLLRVLLQPGLQLLSEGRVQMVKVPDDLLKEGLVDEFVSGIPRDVAADDSIKRNK